MMLHECTKQMQNYKLRGILSVQQWQKGLSWNEYGSLAPLAQSYFELVMFPL